VPRARYARRGGTGHLSGVAGGVPLVG